MEGAWEGENAHDVSESCNHDSNDKEVLQTVSQLLEHAGSVFELKDT